jgi:hypothetical protein
MSKPNPLTSYSATERVRAWLSAAVWIAFWLTMMLWIVAAYDMHKPACPAPPAHSWLDPRTMGPAQSFTKEP